MISTFFEKHIVRKTSSTPKPQRWENLLNGSWNHPRLGIVQKVSVGHKFKFDWYAFPEEMNQKLRLGPFIKKTEALKALEEFHGPK